MFDNLPVFRQVDAMPPTTSTGDVGQNIRAEAARRRINMVKLSAATGIPRTTLLGQINASRIAATDLLKIAKALDVPLSTLLGESVA